MTSQSKRHAILLMLTLLGLDASLPGQTIAITGTVVDSSSSQPISGAVVKVVEYPQITATTASNGTFTLSGTATGVLTSRSQRSAEAAISLRNNGITIRGARASSALSIDVFECNGARVRHYENHVDNTGRVSIGNLRRSTGFYYFRITLDGKTSVFSSENLAAIGAAPGETVANRFAKTAAAACTLAVNATNYAVKQVALTSITATAGTIRLPRLAIQVGVWTDVTPAGLSLDPNFYQTDNNYGCHDVLADPVRPGDLYSFNDFQGVWKSTDFGLTWTKITAAGVLATGRAWSSLIDPDTTRNPTTPPTIWTCQGYGDGGVWKSTDGGVTWARNGAVNDPRSYQVDPYDHLHILCGIHEGVGVKQTLDGGSNWSDATGNMNSSGISWDPFFINTGNPTTTRTTWLAIAQATGGGVGTLRTTNSGSTWIEVSHNEHVHGNSGIFQANGVLYMGGQYAIEGDGVLRSTDLGITWSHVGAGMRESTVFGTPNHIYAMCNGATHESNPPNFQVGSANGLTWSSPSTPPSMSNGQTRTAVTYDRSIGKYILVGGCGNAGIWRYIEP